MAVVKVRTATQKEQKCGKCGVIIKIKEQYADTDQKLNPPKPFPTVKFCIPCSKDEPIKETKKK